MTVYNSQVGGGMYKIQMETDRSEVYECVQNVIRSFIDLERPCQVVKKTAVAEETTVCGCVCEENTKEEA